MPDQSVSPIFRIDKNTRIACCDPHNAAFYSDPYSFYAQLHEKCPRFIWQEYGHWCFANWDDVNALFRDKRFGRQILHVATREELGWPEPAPHTADFAKADSLSLLYLEPPDHTRLRTLVNRAFVSRQVEQLRPKIADLSHELIDQFEAKGEADLISAFAAPIPVRIIAEMLGVPTEMAPQLLDWSHAMVRMYMFGRTREDEDNANSAARQFMDYVIELAAKKRKNPGEDLISHMLQTEHRGQRLSEDELVSTSILLLNAGHEATVHQTGNAIKTVLEHASEIALDMSKDDQVAGLVEECIRFDAPLHMFTRYALEDVDLGDGIVIKKGAEIGLMLGAANRDPARFADAGVFKPRREDVANVSFGAGIHFCIGSPLARIELQESLRAIFTRLPRLKLAEPPRYSDAYHFHGLEALRVSF